MATRALWRDRDYLAWLVGDTAGALTGAMRLFAIPLIAYATTGSAALAGGAYPGTEGALRLLVLGGSTGVWRAGIGGAAACRRVSASV